jgi:hypothetical protein
MLPGMPSRWHAAEPASTRTAPPTWRRRGPRRAGASRAGARMLRPCRAVIVVPALVAQVQRVPPRALLAAKDLAPRLPLAQLLQHVVHVLRSSHRL